MPKDPGAVPSVTAGVRWTSDSGNDDIYVVADAINGGQWGYNNLQWFGLTYYHKFNDQWHISFETLQPSPEQRAQPALIPCRRWRDRSKPEARRSRRNIMPFNAPDLAQCAQHCRALLHGIGCRPIVAYLNYKATPLDNISYRVEFYDDKQGQRTGTKTRYVETGIGWQHWFSPQIEIRPEVTYYKSLDAIRLQRQREPRHSAQQELRPRRCGGRHHSLLK